MNMRRVYGTLKGRGWVPVFRVRLGVRWVGERGGGEFCGVCWMSGIE